MIDPPRVGGIGTLTAGGRVSPPGIGVVPTAWAFLAAGGASFFVGAALTMFFAIALRAVGGYPAAGATGLVTACALGAALGVAYIAGGRVAVAAYAGWIALERLLVLASQLRFCAAVFPAPPACSLLAILGGLWPYALGGALGYGLARWMRPVDRPRNALLEAAGALMLSETFIFTTLRTLVPSPTDLEAGLIQLVAGVAAGSACALILLRRADDSSAQWRLLGIVALVTFGVWALVTVPAFAAQVGVAGGMRVGMVGLLAFAFPFLETGVAAIALYMAAARRIAATAS